MIDTGLEELWLDYSGIGDAGIKHLAGLSRLRVLNLDGTAVTDAGLAYLTGLKDLQFLNISNTKVTDVAVTKLKTARPGLDIHLRD